MKNRYVLQTGPTGSTATIYQLSNYYASEIICDLNPQIIFSDFEITFMNAALSIFSNSNVNHNITSTTKLYFTKSPLGPFLPIFSHIGRTYTHKKTSDLPK